MTMWVAYNPFSEGWCVMGITAVGILEIVSPREFVTAEEATAWMLSQ